jgi:hypothetical protein
MFSIQPKDDSKQSSAEKTAHIDKIQNKAPELKKIEEEEEHARKNAILQPLYEFISKKIKKTFPEEDHKLSNLKAKKSLRSKEESAVSIQRFWNMHRFKKNFFSDYNSELYSQMLQKLDLEYKRLSELIYGKTIANVNWCTDKDDLRVLNRFPAKVHPGWKKKSRYHREDFATEAFDSKLTHTLFKHFVKNVNNDKYFYIPITMTHNFGIDNFIDRYLTPIQKKRFKIYKEEKQSICVISIKKSSSKPTVAVTLAHKVHAAGLIASPFEISKFNAKLYKENKKKDVKTVTEEKKKVSHYHFKSEQFSYLPTDIQQLKKSKMITELKTISKSNSPNKYLAGLISDMILGLPVEEYTTDGISRIALILNMACLFQKDNYERFAFSLYFIAHEISLLLNELMEKGKAPISYYEFKKIIDQNDNNNFGLDLSQLKHSASIAAPAISGTHAFSIALSLAEKMHVSEPPPTIEVIKPCYYEFERYLLKKKKENDEDKIKNKDEETLKDIYLLSIGPVIVSSSKSNPCKSGVYPGTDINKLVKKLLNNKEDLPKNITLVVDVTSGLHKNLKLDDKVKELVQKGRISIICYESCQKFGLAHTDQAQAGMVYGVCSMQSIAPDILHEFAENAKKDLESHLDMMIAAYIHQKGGPYLELIKKNRHFVNGSLLREFFIKTKMYKPSENEVYYPEMLDNLNELYFFIAMPHNEKLYNALKQNFLIRDSFGHMYSSTTAINGVYRLSLNASDEFDTFIHITKLYLFIHFDRKAQLDLLQQIIENIFNRKDKNSSLKKEMTFEQKILLSGLLTSLCDSDDSSKNKIYLLSEEFLLSFSTRLLYNKDSRITGRFFSQQLFSKMHEINYFKKDNVSKINSLNSKDHSELIDTVSIKRYLNRNPEYKDFISLYQNIVAFENMPSDDKQKRVTLHAVIILKLNNLWRCEIKNSHRTICEYDFKAHPAICEAISIIYKEKCLKSEFIFILLQDNIYANQLACCIIALSDSKLLNENIMASILKNDVDTKYFIEHLFEKISSGKQLTKEDIYHHTNDHLFDEECLHVGKLRLHSRK